MFKAFLKKNPLVLKMFSSYGYDAQQAETILHHYKNNLGLQTSFTEKANMAFLAIAETASFIFMPTKGNFKILKRQIIKTYDPNRYATEQDILLSAKHFLATELNTQLFHERQKRSFERQFKPDLALKTSPLK